MSKANFAWIFAISMLIIFDIAMVACNNTPGDTLSEAIWAMNFDPKSFFLGQVIGVVMGHLFWQRGDDEG